MIRAFQRLFSKERKEQKESLPPPVLNEGKQISTPPFVSNKDNQISTMDFDFVKVKQTPIMEEKSFQMQRAPIDDGQEMIEFENSDQSFFFNIQSEKEVIIEEKGNDWSEHIIYYIEEVLNAILELKISSLILQGHSFKPTIEEIRNQFQLSIRSKIEKIIIAADFEKVMNEFMELLAFISNEDLTGKRFQEILKKVTGIEIAISSIVQSNQDNNTESFSTCSNTALDILGFETKDIHLLIQQKLKSPEKSFEDIRQSVACLLSCIEMGQKEADKSINKDIVLFLGNTGAGKSTLINYLCGCKLQQVPMKALGLKGIGKAIIVAEDSEIKEIAKIGHENSTTFMPGIFPNESMTYVDCPGFFDDRGMEINMANAVNIKNTIKKASTLKIVILINATSLLADRGKSIKELFDMIKALFGEEENIKKYSPSILIGVTNLNLDTAITLDDVADTVCKENSPLQWLRENIFIFDVLDRKGLVEFSSKDDIIERINTLPPLRDHSAIFRTGLSDKDYKYLAEINNIIASEIDTAFRGKKFTKAAQYLSCLHYLKIIDHEDINNLYIRNFNQVNYYVEEAKRDIYKYCDNFNFKEAEELIIEFKGLINAFKSMHDFSQVLLEVTQYLKEKQIENLSIKFSSRMEELCKYYYENHSEKIAISYDLYFILKQEQKILQSSETSYKLYHLLAQLCQSKYVGKLVSGLILALVELSLLTKEQTYIQQVQRCMQTLQEIIKTTEQVVAEENKNKLTIIEAKIANSLKRISQDVTWEAGGKEVLARLRIFWPEASKNLEKETLESLVSIKLIQEPIKILNDSLNTLKELAKFSDCRNACEQTVRTIFEAFKILKKQLEKDARAELVAILESKIANSLKRISQDVTWEAGGKEVLAQLKNWRLAESNNFDEGKLIELAKINFIKDPIKVLNDSLNGLKALAKFSDCTMACEQCMQQIYEVFNALKKQLEKSERAELVAILESKIANSLKRISQDVTWEAGGKEVLTQLKNWRLAESNNFDGRMLIDLAKINFIKDPIKVLNNSLNGLKALAEFSDCAMACEQCMKQIYEVFNALKEQLEKSERAELVAILESKIANSLKRISQDVTWEAGGKEVLTQLKIWKFGSSEIINEEMLLELTKIVLIKGAVEILCKSLKFSKAIEAFPDCKMVYEHNVKTIYGSFIVLKNRLEQDEKDEKNKLAQNLVLKINADLEKNNYNDIKKEFLLVKKLDHSKIPLINIKSQILRLEKTVRESFDQGNYSFTKNSINWLITLNAELENIVDDLKILPKVQNLKDEMIEKIVKMQEAAEKELRIAFEDSTLNKESLENEFKRLNSFFKICQEFKELLPILSKQFSKVIRICFALANASYVEPAKKSPIEIANLLMQTQMILDAVSNNSSLTPYLEDLIKDYLKKCDASKIHMIGDKLKLIKLKSTSEYGRFAGEILDKYPQFIRINIQLFNDKASKSADDIFNELKLDNNSNSVLKKSFVSYQKIYEFNIQELINAFKEGKDTTQLERELILGAKKQASNLLNKENFSKCPQEVGELLGYIFGEWTYLDAYKGDFMTVKNSLLQPHAAQIISILLLFGMDNNEPIQNHLLQIKTGEGKSVTAAGAAIALALMGYKVDIACYSPYLASRDQGQFQLLFNKFNVNNYIYYGEFGQLLNARTDEIGDLRQLSRELLENNVKGNTKNASNFKKILFIDEVDVFFSDKFLGNTYEPLLVLKDPHFQQLLKLIWEKSEDYLADRELAKSNIKNHELMNKFLSKYPNASMILDIQLKDILQSLYYVKKGYYSYICSEKEGIGSENAISATISYNIAGYSTFFAYIKESLNGRITADLVDKKIGFSVNAGYIAYTELPKSYQFLLGVTGTLSSLSAYEKQIIKNYKVNRETIIPSLFNKQSIKGDKDIDVFGGEMDAEDTKSYFFNIKKEIETTINVDRAVLVVFENNERLEKFKTYVDTHNYNLTNIKCNILTSKTLPEDKAFIISAASARGQITLLTKAYGRGSDFICRDSEVKRRDGVHVVQTFFSEHESEEIQIKGRTCRQDDPGSYKMILFLDDLKKYDVTKQSDLDEYRKINPDAQWYDFLKLKRETYQQNKSKQLEESLKNAQQKHDKTMRYIELLERNSFFSTSHKSAPLSSKQEALELFYKFQNGLA